jgi:RES domain-containing protein
MDLWRVSNYITLDGEGSRRAPARWHSGGEPIVYMASATGNALLEVLVHLQVEDNDIPRVFTLLRITAPDDLEIPLLHTPKNPDDDSWKHDLTLTRSLGDAWLRGRRSALARVPSAILPATHNYLLNPLHPDAARLQIAESMLARFDRRLIPKTKTT